MAMLNMLSVSHHDAQPYPSVWSENALPIFQEELTIGMHNVLGELKQGNVCDL